MCGHQLEMNNTKFPTVYKLLNQQVHSILSRKVRMIKKICIPTNKSRCKEREEYQIRRIGTTKPYWNNDNIKGTGNLSNQLNNNIHAMNLFDKNSRRIRNHGHRHYTPPQMHDVSIDGLLPFIGKTSWTSSHSNKTLFYTSHSTTLPLQNKS